MEVYVAAYYSWQVIESFFDSVTDAGAKAMMQWLWAVIAGWIQWLLDPATIASGARTAMTAIFAFLDTILPESAHSALTSFESVLTGPAVAAVFRIALYLADQFVEQTVLMACLLAFIALWPTFVGLRIAMWVISRFWGNSN